MLSPGTHLVKNHESQSRTNECQLKKKMLKLKMLGTLIYNQTVNLKTDSKFNSVLVQYTEIKIYSFYFKAPQRLKEIFIIK